MDTHTPRRDSLPWGDWMEVQDCFPMIEVGLLPCLVGLSQTPVGSALVDIVVFVVGLWAAGFLFRLGWDTAGRRSPSS